jgi:SM-20-related protein
MEDKLKNIINPNLDIPTLVKEFGEKKVLVIQNFLKDEIAESFYSWFSEEMPSDWWEVSSCPAYGQEKPSFVRNNDENSDEIKERYSEAIEAFRNGSFSYNFYRTLPNHYQDCNCIECKIRNWLVDSECLDFVSEVTSEKYTDSDEVFAACYTSGDFLSPHIDSPNGTLGFVLQLTKNWKPEYGGLLHFMDDDRTVVERIEVPEFNSLTLFYLPKNKGKWHFVSSVSPGTPEIRLSYTGWFK